MQDRVGTEVNSTISILVAQNLPIIWRKLHRKINITGEGEVQQHGIKQLFPFLHIN